MSGSPDPGPSGETQVATLDAYFLVERVGRVPPVLMARVETGPKLVLDL